VRFQGFPIARRGDAADNDLRALLEPGVKLNFYLMSIEHGAGQLGCLLRRGGIGETHLPSRGLLGWPLAVLAPARGLLGWRLHGCFLRLRPPCRLLQLRIFDGAALLEVRFQLCPIVRRGDAADQDLLAISGPVVELNLYNMVIHHGAGQLSRLLRRGSVGEAHLAGRHVLGLCRPGPRFLSLDGLDGHEAHLDFKPSPTSEIALHPAIPVHFHGQAGRLVPSRLVQTIVRPVPAGANLPLALGELGIQEEPLVLRPIYRRT